ncbi:MAG TPA: tetratricopeptide repeat protein, partial [Burkholderiales bacterium]|nr:tetratricopeptide repeat protein [Burkholderiales bacterium]
DRLLGLNPFAIEEYRDRGLLRRAVGDVAGARADLVRYVETMPRAPDARRIRWILTRLG